MAFCCCWYFHVKHWHPQSQWSFQFMNYDETCTWTLWGLVIVSWCPYSTIGYRCQEMTDTLFTLNNLWIRMYITLFAVHTASHSTLLRWRDHLLPRWRRLRNTTTWQHLCRWAVLHRWWRCFWGWLPHLSASWPSCWHCFTSAFWNTDHTKLAIKPNNQSKITQKTWSKECREKWLKYCTINCGNKSDLLADDSNSTSKVYITFKTLSHMTAVGKDCLKSETLFLLVIWYLQY